MSVNSIYSAGQAGSLAGLARPVIRAGISAVADQARNARRGCADCRLGQSGRERRRLERLPFRNTRSACLAIACGSGRDPRPSRFHADAWGMGHRVTDAAGVGLGGHAAHRRVAGWSLSLPSRPPSRRPRSAPREVRSWLSCAPGRRQARWNWRALDPRRFGIWLMSVALTGAKPLQAKPITSRCIDGHSWKAKYKFPVPVLHQASKVGDAPNT